MNLVQRARFEAMNSNRAINDSVVEARFRENLDQLAETGRFKDFGQINLLILLNEPEHVFYVMDGQHRQGKAGDMKTKVERVRIFEIPRFLGIFSGWK